MDESTMLRSRVSDFMTVIRYMRRMPVRKVTGKIGIEVRVRLLAFRVWRTAARTGLEGERSLSPQLRRFAEIYRTRGDRFSDECATLHSGVFVSNGVAHGFGSPRHIRFGEVIKRNPLHTRWEHDLAFFNWSIPLVTREGVKGAETLEHIIASLERGVSAPRDLREFHWSPIALALRIMALSTALATLYDVESSDVERPAVSVRQHIIRCTKLLAIQSEMPLGFNHAVFSEAGLVVGRLVQGRRRSAVRRSKRVLYLYERHVLGDGMWAELTPMYHVHMLHLLRCLLATGIYEGADAKRAEALATKMDSALTAIVHPDGEIAIFNDSAVNDAVSPSTLIENGRPSVQRVTFLPDAGYARLNSSSLSVLMDAGRMGPREVTGHSHADFLAIEVAVLGRRFVVDPGVGAISAGAERAWTRSSSSHNGPRVIGAEPAEFFGTWRVGWAGRAWFTDVEFRGDDVVKAHGVCDGYSREGIDVARRLEIGPSGSLHVTDTWAGASSDELAESTFLVCADWRIEEATQDVIAFRAADGSRARIIVSSGRISGLGTSRYHLEGPAHALRAHSVRMIPEGGILQFGIDADGGRMHSLEEEAVAESQVVDHRESKCAF